MKQFKVNDRVTIPEGYVGVIVEEAPGGQFRIAVQGHRDYWLYDDDLEHWPGEEEPNATQR